MKLLKYIFVLALLYFAMQATAQQITKVSEPKAPATINQVDAAGKRHGLWLLGEEARMGETAFKEFGTYDHGDKTGPWYKIDNDGELFAIENFRNDLLDGEVKYFDKGRLNAVGRYRGLNPERRTDTVIVEDPETGLQMLRSVPVDHSSVRHGMWRFYDVQNGRLTREEEYQIDSLIYSKDFPMSKADSLYYQKRDKGLPHNKKKGK
jgi:hypothetical protein